MTTREHKRLIDQLQTVETRVSQIDHELRLTHHEYTKPQIETISKQLLSIETAVAVMARILGTNPKK